MNRRNKYWLSNACLFHILRHKKRTDNIWLFSAWRGRKYDDNSRYLFEYVNRHCPGIEAVWVCSNPSVIDYVRELGYKAELSSSKEGKKLQRKAARVFYTNGIDDFGDICYVYGASTIALWHGTGFKKLYKANIDYEGVRLFLKKWKDSIFDYTFRDISISTSELATKWIKDCFTIDPSTIFVTGLPRNDAFKTQYLKQNVLHNISNADLYKYIVYMPTHRPFEDKTIETTIKQLISDEVFLNNLRRRGYRLLLKLHPLTKIEFLDLPGEVILLNNNEVSSSQELMAISEVLITDYSSAIIDFAVQEKPSILYTPDYLKYCDMVGVGKDIEEVYSLYSTNTISELTESIIHAIDNPTGMMQLTNRINSMYQDFSIANTCFSENVVRVLEKIDHRSYICEK